MITSPRRAAGLLAPNWIAAVAAPTCTVNTIDRPIAILDIRPIISYPRCPVGTEAKLQSAH
jgi:hypothetical protein